MQTSTAPPQIIFSWPQVDYARQYTIKRKNPGDSDWAQTIAVLPGNATGFTDSDVAVGSVFEYEFDMATSLYPYPQGDPSKWINAYTYVFAGINAPLVDSEGKVLLVVDSSVSGAIGTELGQFEQDLIGAGWNVIRREVARNGSVGDVKNVIRAEYKCRPG